MHLNLASFVTRGLTNFFPNSVFDNLLFRPQTGHDIKEYHEVQRVLREEIVNPLRANLFVRADRIMKLRTMLDHLSSVRGLTTEEKGNTVIVTIH